MKIEILKDTTHSIPKKMTDNSSEKLLYMPVYPKQRLIIEFLNTRPDCTAGLREMIDLPGIYTHIYDGIPTYTYNPYGGLSETLARMVKKKLVIRVGRGKYKSNCHGMERPKKK